MPEYETLVNIEDEVTQIISDLGLIAKIEEMEDFMNQNDLKVQITNESNAANTGLVTYACTVKDKNNNTLANRVVEWYKGTTLLGLDATDSNGISTFNHRVGEAEVYDVHAVVRGTHAGDDIRMFVKDKGNILSTNVWSAGEYSNDTTGFYSSQNRTLTVSPDWCSIGDKSLLVVGTDVSATDLVRLSAGTYESGNYVLKMDVYNIGDDVVVILFNGSTNSQRVTVPQSDEVTPIELTLTADNEGYLSIRIGSITNCKFYCDNISIIPVAPPEPEPETQDT